MVTNLRDEYLPRRANAALDLAAKIIVLDVRRSGKKTFD